MSNTSHGAPSGEPPTADHNLLATYGSTEDARKAIEALERKGVEADHISLTGDGVEATAQPETNLEQRQADMAATGTVGKRAARGLLLGAAIGAILGGVGGYALHELADLGPNPWVVAAAFGVAFAAMGAYAGGFYGGSTALPVSEAWGETFEPGRGGETCVAVHSPDSGEVDRATKALAPTNPLRMVRFGRDGKRSQVA